MNKLIVGFSKPISKLAIGSILIRTIEKSEFSHVFLSWHSDSLNREMVYHASHGMVHFLSGERFNDNNQTIITYEFILDDIKSKNVINKCVDLAGIKYGYLQLLGMGFERITGIRNPFRDKGSSYVCSELVGEVLNQIGIDVSNLDLELAGPKELEIYIKKYIN